jgi:FtsP/CotA-like multicopper oxidase with cupredoxin domain
MKTYPKSSAFCSIIKCLVLGAALASAGNSFALDVFLRAEKFTKSMPDGVSVTMWGYALDSTATGSEGVLSSPGPVITVPAGDNVLNITLINKLSVPTSVVIPGQTIVMTPVFSLATGATCTPNPTDRDCRVRSFTNEATAGSNTVYTYANVKPGTFLYQSGTSPQIQVQMGLYGALKHDASVGTGTIKNAYTSVAYGQDHVLVYSEIDKAVHDAVDAGTFSGSTLNYDPKYFLVNGLGFNAQSPPTEIGAATSGGVLLRLLNAGLRTRVPTFSDGHWSVVAEDGNAYRNAKEQYTAFLPAGKTTDVWFSPSAAATSATYTVFDRRLGLTNNNSETSGGMMHKFSLTFVAGSPRLSGYVATPSVATQDITSTFTPVLVGGQAPFAYSLEVAPIGMIVNAATGVLTWKPTNEQARRPAAPGLTNAVAVRVTDANGRFARQTLSVQVTNVNDAPVAMPDTFDVYGGVLATPAKGIIRKAVDPDGDVISGLIVNQAGLLGSLSVTTSGPSMGAFNFTANTTTIPAIGYSTQQFTYTVSDGTLTSNIGTITLNIHANKAPVANNDRYAFAFAGTPVTRLLPSVTINDIDSDGTINPVSVTITDSPNNGGTVSVNPGTGRISYKARLGFKGTDTFTYTVKDNLGAVSNKAYVQVDTR